MRQQAIGQGRRQGAGPSPTTPLSAKRAMSSAERLDPDQLALGIEDLGADVARTEAHQAVSSGGTQLNPLRRIVSLRGTRNEASTR